MGDEASYRREEWNLSGNRDPRAERNESSVGALFDDASNTFEFILGTSYRLRTIGPPLPPPSNRL